MSAPDYYQLSTRFLPARYQAALLLEHARVCEIEPARLLAGTTLATADLFDAERLISPAEYLQLLANLQGALNSADTSFLIGAQLLPGHYGHLSHALLHAVDLRQAITILIDHQAWLSPLLAPHFVIHGGDAVLYWTDSCMHARQRGFVVEMMMAAVSGMARWLAGIRLPWRYRFNRTRPTHIEQYAVHLGPDLHFGDCLDAMVLPLEYLDQRWPRGNLIAASAALADGGVAGQRSLPAALYDYLSERIRIPPTLDQASADFGVSPATFKRHLAAQGTHYQAEIDQVRVHVALALIHNQALGNEQIAHYLGFHDATNFRRSFKRWTGLTPSVFRAHLAGDWGH
ncbi:AraC family transcriptional regulator ligand-binding domain-containing protein [Thauera sp.]